MQRPIKIRRSIDDQFYFTVSASNGRIINTSEMYKRKRSCYTGINAMCASLNKLPREVAALVQDLAGRKKRVRRSLTDGESFKKLWENLAP